MDNQNKLKCMFWRRAFSTLIDIVFIYCISYLVRLLIMQFVFIDSFIVFAIIWFLYYLACYLFLKGRTLAKVITGLQLIANKNKEVSIKHILIRELVSKSFILLIIPAYLLNGNQSQIRYAAVFIIALVIITVGLFFILKKTWWDLLSGTKTIKNPITYKPFRLVSLTSIVGIFIITIFVKIYPFMDNQQLKTTFYPKYPINSETKKYADFINIHSQNPVDYVFSLFEKYDLVVLSERMHPEYSQYELISKIVSDKRFASKIGNIYTECGSISFQDTLNKYLNAVFLNEDSLNKATAFLYRSSNAIWPLWSNTNLFELLKHVNKLNNMSVDSLKINWYFTDIPVNWETMTPSKYKKQVGNKNRDKIMADNIVEVYRHKLLKNDKRVKGLVIMNTRHGYGLIKNEKGQKTRHFFNRTNATAILMDSLQNKVCNVMLNTNFIKYGMIKFPIQNGKWDRAFAMSGNPDIGFDFANSPFGQDKFEGNYGMSKELKFKNVFTGFIFYKPLEQHVTKNSYPYMLYNFEDSLLRRAECVGLSNLQDCKRTIENNKIEKVKAETLPYAVIYNLIVNVCFSIIIGLTMILGLIFYIMKMKNEK